MAVDNQDTTAEAPQPDSTKQSGLLKKLLRFKWLGSRRGLTILLAASVVAHGILLLAPGGNVGKKKKTETEVTLGTYRFEAGAQESAIQKAEFQLHIRLLSEVDELAHERLEHSKFKLQQEIEELLRQAHGGDFADPKLNELKHQLQETINGTLKVRAISDVIITDLQLQYRENDATHSENSAPATLPAATSKAASAAPSAKSSSSNG